MSAQLYIRLYIALGLPRGSLKRTNGIPPLRKPDGQKRGTKNTGGVRTEVKATFEAGNAVISPILLEPACEDRASHNRHLNFLKKELKTSTPTNMQALTNNNHACSLLIMQITQDLTKRTFPFRRQDVLDGKITTQDLFVVL